MNTSEMYTEIARSLDPQAAYDGNAHEYVLTRLVHVAMLLDASLERIAKPSTVRTRIGVLEDHEMIVSAVKTGLRLDQEQLSGVLLTPMPYHHDLGGALRLGSGEVLGWYANRNGYESFAAWDSINYLDHPADETRILEGLLIEPIEVEVAHGLTGTGIAVRYLLETQTGAPLGFE